MDGELPAALGVLSKFRGLFNLLSYLLLLGGLYGAYEATMAVMDSVAVDGKMIALAAGLLPTFIMLRLGLSCLPEKEKVNDDSDSDSMGVEDDEIIDDNETSEVPAEVDEFAVKEDVVMEAIPTKGKKF